MAEPARLQPIEPRPQGEAAARPDGGGRVPAITIQVFAETPEVAAAAEAAGADRRLARAHLTVQTGGMAAATELYRRQASPHLIMVESSADEDALIAALDRLADVCEATTKVVVIGASNDIRLYRELLDRGVSEYLLAPVDAMQLVATAARLYRDSGAERLGRAFAFIGAKGGAGSSTVAHNVAWAVARELSTDIVLADLDMPFGTASLDFNMDAAQGVAEAIQDAGRLDEVLLERLLAKHDDHLSLLAAPTGLDRSYDLDESAFDRLLDLVQASVPFLILDVPHLWCAWAKKTLVSADEVVVTAEPDLASLRNAKNLVEFLGRARPNDPPPKLVVNQVGMPKRPEIKPADFAAALQLEPAACIAFDPATFGAAANKGQMVGEVAARSRAAGAFTELAQTITGRRPPQRRSGFSLGRLLGR
ncbi:MAG TPA: CpaE family protein [Afifellaceae bacterium]|nr:CpaE family protein [Afifellaceae bacterium]